MKHIFIWTDEGELMKASTEDVVAWLAHTLAHENRPGYNQMLLVEKLRSLVDRFNNGIELP